MPRPRKNPDPHQADKSRGYVNVVPTSLQTTVTERLITLSARLNTHVRETTAILEALRGPIPESGTGGTAPPFNVNDGLFRIEESLTEAEANLRDIMNMIGTSGAN